MILFRRFCPMSWLRCTPLLLPALLVALPAHAGDRTGIPLIVTTAAAAALVLGVFLALIVDYAARVRTTGAKMRAAPSPRKRLDDGLDYPSVPAREGVRPAEPAPTPAVAAGRRTTERN